MLCQLIKFLLGKVFKIKSQVKVNEYSNRIARDNIKTMLLMTLILTLTDLPWLNGFIQYFFAPFMVASIAYYLFGKRDEYIKHKRYSILGVELITVLIEEIETGYNIIIEPLSPKYYNEPPNPLPHKCWNGINTIPDEILLRIFELSNDIPDEGFPAKEIRIHTKNYYEYYITNWELMVQKLWVTSLTGGDDDTINDYKLNYGVATKNVLKTLYHVRSLLEKNTKKTFPK